MDEPIPATKPSTISINSIYYLFLIYAKPNLKKPIVLVKNIDKPHPFGAFTLTNAKGSGILGQP